MSETQTQRVNRGNQQGAMGQPVTKVGIYECRKPRGGLAKLAYKKRLYQTKAEMRRIKPQGGFEVAIDVNNTGAKNFTYFLSHEEFFQETYAVVNRHFYEIIVADTPCCLYFDLEHYTQNDSDDSKIETALRVIQREVQKMWPKATDEVFQSVQVLTASRQSKGLYKHSFHVIYPSIGFHCNHNEMKQMAHKLALVEELKSKGSKQEEISMIDTNVYHRDQAFRLIESWKYTTDPTPDMALEYQHQQPHTMRNLLATVVTNTTKVSLWCGEQQGQDDRSNDMYGLLHQAGLDGITILHEQCIGYNMARCPCSHVKLRESETTFQIRQNRESWYLECQHMSCKIAQMNQYPLGTIRRNKVSRVRGDRAELPTGNYSPATEKQHNRIMGNITIEVMTQLAEAVAKIKGWETNPRDGCSSPRNRTYMITPEQTSSFLESVEDGRTDRWNFLRHKEKFRILLRDEVDLAWVSAMFHQKEKKLWIEQSMGTTRMAMIRSLCRWIEATNNSDDLLQWEVMVAGAETASDPMNAAVLTWASTLMDNVEDRVTADSITQIQSLAIQGLDKRIPDTAMNHCVQFSGKMCWKGVHPWKKESEAKRPKHNRKKQTTLAFEQSAPETTNRGQVLLAEGAVPIRIGRGAELEPEESFEWCEIPRATGKTTRVISQNMGPVGLLGGKNTIHRLIRLHNPGVLLLQDCRIKSANDKRVVAMKQEFPQYQIFVQCGTQHNNHRRRPGYTRAYHYTVAVMIHEDCGKGQELFGNDQILGRHKGRLLTIKLQPASPQADPFLVTCLYNYVAKEQRKQEDLLTTLQDRMKMDSVSKYKHIIGGDFNATLLPQTRRGYSSDPNVVSADKRIYKFVMTEDLAQRWWVAHICNGIWTRRNPSRAQAGRIDEILVLDPKLLDFELEAREEGGKGYMMYAVDHGDTRLDHYTVTADLPTSLVAKPRHASRKQVEVVDKETWTQNMEEWRVRVSKGFKPPTSTDPFEQLKQWSQIAVQELPKKLEWRGGTRQGRQPHKSNEQKRCWRQIRLLEKESFEADKVSINSFRVTSSVRQICSWQETDGIPSIKPPTQPITEGELGLWRKALQDGIAARRKLINDLTRAQQQQAFQKLKEDSRQKMDRPGEKEIQRLMGKRIDTKVSADRASRHKSKRHPDKIDARLSHRKWIDWITTLKGGKEICEKIINFQNRSAEEQTAQMLGSGEITLEILRTSASEMRIRCSPMHVLTDLLQQKPELDVGEFIVVSSSDLQKIKHESDSVCHEEFFFATNAMDDRSYCGKCKCERTRPIPLSHVAEDGKRSLKYYCPSCQHITTWLPTKPLEDCPVPNIILERQGFDPESPVLTRDLSRDDFNYWLAKLPHRKSAGEDDITYEMWQQAPEGMKTALYVAVQAALTGKKIPEEWEGAITKLLPKKPGEEGILESLRPICLMQTAVKIVTGIWARRLSQENEKRQIVEGSQEGFRPDRSARRQAARLLSCIGASRRKQGKLVVAFLDFENYFNTISLPALFFLLRKLGLCENDVAVLEQYYKTTYLQVKHNDGTMSARVPLGRGLRQGCPLSPILGGLMVNTMLRWIESQGGGVSHPSGVETNILAFADDTTLTTEGVRQMEKLLQRVHEFCEWAGVRINLNKSEITGYDFRRNSPIFVGGLKIGTGNPKYISPHTPFRYLGIRLTVTGDLRAEREYVIAKTQAAAAMLEKHDYHPRQIHWLVQIAIVPIFRYSAALAGWDGKGIGEIQKHWVRAYKHAWKVNKSTPAVHFLSAEHAGLDTPTVGEVLTKELTTLALQITSIHDDLYDIFKTDIIHTVMEQGCSTIQEATKELAYTETPSTMCSIFLQRIGRSTDITWKDMMTETRMDKARRPIRLLVQQVEQPGIMELMPEEPLQGMSEEAWKGGRRILRQMAAMGLHRKAMVQKGAIIELPSAMIQHEREEVVQALEEMAKVRGKELLWTKDLTGRNVAKDRDPLARIRPGDTGQSLVGGEVRLYRKHTHLTGRISGYDPHTNMYQITLQDNTAQCWSFQQVLGQWWQYRKPPWTREDQIQLSQKVVAIIGEKRTELEHEVKTPLPTLISEEKWVEKATFYTCRMRWDFAPDIKQRIDTRVSIGSDRDIAKALCESRSVFWAPKSTWDWSTTSNSNRAGWMVQAREVKEKDGQIFVIVRSLHQIEHHREGEIRVSSKDTACIRSIAKENAQRTNLVLSLSAAELGETNEGGYEPCEALVKWKARGLQQVHQPAGKDRMEIQYPPIERRPTPAKDEPPLVKFCVDMSSMHASDTPYEESGKHFIITKRRGQAHKIENATGGKRARNRGSILSGGARRELKTGTMPIEEARWNLIQNWFPQSEWMAAWDQEWKRTNDWENAGGRTIHWEITSYLRSALKLKQVLKPQWITVDPSFDAYTARTVQDTQTNTERLYVPLYEMTDSDKSECMAFLSLYKGKWIAITEGRDTTHKKMLKIGRIMQTLKKGQRVCMKKGWWQTGERKPIKARNEYTLWLSNNWDDESKTKKFQGEEEPMWIPDRGTASQSLKIYLEAQPSANYYRRGYTVLATDGSLRLRRNTGTEPSMGAGVAWDNRDEGAISARVGGQYSSTRAELAAIALALHRTLANAKVAILVDSSSALQRLSWFRSKDFQPSMDKVKDRDIVKDILQSLDQRYQQGHHTVLVKVTGHTGEPLHMKADHLAVKGAEEESQEKIEYPNGREGGLTFRWQEGSDKKREEQWGPRVKKRIREKEMEEAWETRPRGTCAERFMAREQAGRQLLGSALRRTWDWAVRGWMQSLTPYKYPVKVSLRRWGKADTDQCACGKGKESFEHVQLACMQQDRRSARQRAHNEVVLAIEEYMSEVRAQHRVSLWDKQVKTFIQRLRAREEADENGNGVTTRGRKLGQQARGTGRGGEKNPGEGYKRKWKEVEETVSEEAMTLRPDGMVFDEEKRHLFIVEVARTKDDEESLRNRYIRKELKYAKLKLELGRALGACRMEQITLVIGLQGSVDENKWRQQLTGFGMTRNKQDMMMRECMLRSIEGTHNVLRAQNGQQEE